MPGLRLGLIVNPIAGLGGTVALGGTDGRAAEALGRGAVPRATARAAAALSELARTSVELDVRCYDDDMGAVAVRTAGLNPTVVGKASATPSTALDTRRAARDLLQQGVELLLFAGGDGTACDLVDSIGTGVPVIGIPAGVKMHSSVFATTPAAAGALAWRYLSEVPARRAVWNAEVMDVHEAARARGWIAARLHGVLASPHHPRLRQNPKAGATPSGAAALQALGASVAQRLETGTLYLLGPGTTTLAIKTALGFRGSLLGVDAVRDATPVGLDLTEAQILDLLADGAPSRLIVSPLGGQGFVFGRGNQQLSSAVLHAIGREGIVLVSTLKKLLALNGAALLVDTGDPGLDAGLAGWHRVIVAPDRSTVYRIAP